MPLDRLLRVHPPFAWGGGSFDSVSWLWVLPASVVIGAVVVMAVVLRRVADEAAALQRSLARWDHMAVAVGDLEHDAHQAERNLRRLTRR